MNEVFYKKYYELQIELLKTKDKLNESIYVHKQNAQQDFRGNRETSAIRSCKFLASLGDKTEWSNLNDRGENCIDIATRLTEGSKK